MHKAAMILSKNAYSINFSPATNADVTSPIRSIQQCLNLFLSFGLVICLEVRKSMAAREGVSAGD
jgi:hypothetical protein